MDYQTLKRNIIETARRDPVGFLYAQLPRRGKGVYYGHASAPSLDYGPTIMHVVDDGDHISLTVAVWGEGECLTYEKTTYKAHSMPNENGAISWEFDDTTCDRGDDYKYDGAELFIDKLIIVESFNEWEDLVGDIAARGNPEEDAWFFPVGVNAACKYLGKMMHTSGRDETREGR